METLELENVLYRKVLLIDDDEIDLFVNERIITLASFARNVFKESNATKALEYLEKITVPDEVPDFVFLDLNMPGMNGFEFLIKFEGLPQYIVSKCKIIVLSSTSSLTDIEKLNSFHCVYKFIEKPLDNNKLKAIFEKL